MSRIWMRRVRCEHGMNDGRERDTSSSYMTELIIIGLFCKRAPQKRLYSTKETSNFREPANRSQDESEIFASSYMKELIRMTHSCVWHDSFMCVTWLIHVCDMTYSCVWQALSECVTRFIYLCDIHDSSTCVTGLIRMCAMTHWNVWVGDERWLTFQWVHI